jgi:hypothetical protein
VIKIVFLPLLLLVLLLPYSSHAQLSPGTSGTISSLLSSNGFENIRTIARNDTLFVALENRVWRWDPRGAAEALRVVVPSAGSSRVISVTFLRTGIPITTLVVPVSAYDSLIAGTMPAERFAGEAMALLSDRSWRSALRPLKPVRPSFCKFDVSVIPQLKAQFGNFDGPLEFQFNIAPAVQISFLRGMTFTGQVIFPVYSNLPDDPEGNTIRPGIVTLSQSFRLPSQVFTTLSAGYFTRNRYGLAGDARKYLFNGRLSAGVALGVTGEIRLVEGVFNYSSLDRFTWFCDAAWRWARYDLTLGAGYGGFLNGDEGWRADLSRQFGEVSIGFFAMVTGGMVNGGFNFRVPLPPRKYGTKNHIRLRPPSDVAWEYRAKGLPAYGRTFSPGTSAGEMLYELNPDYLRTHVGGEITGRR